MLPNWFWLSPNCCFFCEYITAIATAIVIIDISVPWHLPCYWFSAGLHKSSPWIRKSVTRHGNKHLLLLYFSFGMGHVVLHKVVPYFPLDEMAAIFQTWCTFQIHLPEWNHSMKLFLRVQWTKSRQAGDRPLPKPLLMQSTDAYMRHYEEMS